MNESQLNTTLAALELGGGSGYRGIGGGGHAVGRLGGDGPALSTSTITQQSQQSKGAGNWK